MDVTLPARVLAGGADTSVAAARAPRHRFDDELASGALVEVLADFPPTPTPISVLYPGSQQLSRRVRVFIDWLVDTLAPQLVPARRP